MVANDSFKAERKEEAAASFANALVAVLSDAEAPRTPTLPLIADPSIRPPKDKPPSPVDSRSKPPAGAP